MGPLGANETETVIDGGGPILATSRSTRSHSEAERKRRQRINGHLATLRSLLPSASRMDKAALLGEVVRHVRELRGKADDVAVGVGVLLPGEGDEVGVELAEEVEEGKRVRAWVCCADRPGLMGELSRAVGSVRARAVRAEMATVGGRTRSLLEVEMVGEESRAALQAALRAVLLNRSGGVAESFKRPRLSPRLSKT
ncbi:transcription factor bHLH106-like [Typha latifolia]